MSTITTTGFKNLYKFLTNGIFIHGVVVATLTFASGEIATANNQLGLKLYSHLADRLSPTEDLTLFPFPFSSLLGFAFKNPTLTLNLIQEDNLFGTEERTHILRDFKRVVEDFQELGEFCNSTLYLTSNNETQEENVQSAKTNFNLDVNVSSNASSAFQSRCAFDLPWASPFFSPSHTQPSPFFTDESHSTQVPTMFGLVRGVPFASIPALDATAVAIPLSASSEEEDFHRLELIILLPDSRTGLEDLESKLRSPFPFSHITAAFSSSRDLFVYLPKFKIEGDSVNINLTREGLGGAVQMLQDTQPMTLDETGLHQGGKGPSSSTLKKSKDNNAGFQYLTRDSFRVNRPFLGFLYDQERHILLSAFRKVQF